MLIGCEDRVISRAWIIRSSIIVPTLGMRRSHVGNKVFPRWEYITSLGVEMVWSKRYLVETKWKVSEILVER